MKLLQVTKMFGECCCCVSLSSGTKIIGITSAVATSIITVLYTAPLLLVSDLHPTNMAFYATMAVISAVHFCLSCLMIYGTYQKKPKLFWPWILFSWLVGGSLLILSAVGVILLYTVDTPPSTEVLLMISFYIVYAALLIYFGLVVRSRASELAWDLMYLRKHTRYTELRNRPTHLYS